jgi:hypothetical protein
MQPLPQATETQPIEPSLWYALLGAPLFVIGLIIFGFTFYNGLRQITSNVTQVVVPGGVILELQPGETYTVFQEKGVLVKGKTYSDWPQFNSMTCTLTQPYGNQSVELRNPKTRLTYNWGNRHGVSVADFTVPSSGKYDFTCEKKGDLAVPEGVIAIGGGVAQSMGSMFAQGMISLLIGCGLGIAIFLIIIAQRDRSKRRIRAEGFRPV